MINKFSAVILAAGYSGRMGAPKWSLMFDENSTFAEKIVDEFALAGAEKIVLVLNESGKEQFEKKGCQMPENFQIALNDNPDLGRFYSLQKGLKLCNPELPVCFTNIDNPFINAELVKSLLSYIDSADYITPSYHGKGGHPVCISTKVFHSVIESDQYETNLKKFLLEFKREKLEVEDNKILLNINTQTDYQKVFN